LATVQPEPENPSVSDLSGRVLLLIGVCLLLSGCWLNSTVTSPAIEFNTVPLIDEGGSGKIATIEGRVIGARPGQQIVLYARSGAWYVQPFTDQPFTRIQEDSTWRNSTHLGTEYAALLVDAKYRPPARTDVLPNVGDAVTAVLVVPGEVKLLLPAFWQTWWFQVSGVAACLFALLLYHRLRLRQLTRRLNSRFEERLEERMRIAQDLHDTLLQGFLSASMQLHIAVERLPEDLRRRLGLNQVQQLMGEVIEEGRNTVQGLRSISGDSLDLGQAFSRIEKELAREMIDEEGGKQTVVGVIVVGQPRALHPILRDEVYRIGREALLNAFHQSRAESIEVKLEYKPNQLRVLIRASGLQQGRDGKCGQSIMRARAERIGARLRTRVIPGSKAGTEVELQIPGQIAYLNQSSTEPAGWLARLLSPRWALASLRKLGRAKENK